MELPAAFTPSSPSAKAASDALLDPRLALSGRYVHIDLTRACCIICVCFHQFDDRFATYNVLFNQNWVLPLLWLVCGICFGLSERPVHHYVGRLTLYAGLGLLANASAWALNYQNTRDARWDAGTHFWAMVAQMQFVMSLIAICILLAPLKAYLRRIAEDWDAQHSDEPNELMGRDRMLWSILVIVSGCIGIIVAFAILEPTVELLVPPAMDRAAALGLQTSHSAVYTAVRSMSLYLQITLSGFWVLWAFLSLYPQKSLAAWMLMANFYGYMLCYDYGSGAHFFHGFYLVMVAVTAVHLGLWGRKQAGNMVLRYWMVAAFCVTFLWQPGERLHNLEPPAVFVLKERYVLIEAVIVSMWLCAGQNLFDVKIFTEDRLTWVNDWALVAFLSHNALLWIFGFALGWSMLLAMGPIFWLCARMQEA